MVSDIQGQVRDRQEGGHDGSGGRSEAVVLFERLDAAIRGARFSEAQDAIRGLRRKGYEVLYRGARRTPKGGAR